MQPCYISMIHIQLTITLKVKPVSSLIGYYNSHGVCNRKIIRVVIIKISWLLLIKIK